MDRSDGDRGSGRGRRALGWILALVALAAVLVPIVIGVVRLL